MADKRLKGISRESIFALNVIGKMSAVVPKMSSPLNMLLPMTLPREIPELPFSAELRLITSSGSDVPSATIVRPITSSLILKRRASADAPSVSRLAPHKMMASAPMKNRIVSIMFLCVQ
jgi:hypothetical protein